MTNHLPKITVVTPSFNQGELLEETILSVLNQSYPNLEYIIIDGGSTDSSLDVIKKYAADIDFWVSEKDNGQSDAINKGLRRATGDLVAWLNSDDLYVENSLWHAAEVYQQNPDADLIVGNGYRYEWPSGRLQRFCPRHVTYNLEALAHGLDYILQPSTFFSNKVLHKVGLLREDLHYAMDWELWHRIGSNGKVVVTDQPISMSREYAETKTSTGGFKRWEEIRKLGQMLTNEECTAGALFFLTETVNGYLVKKHNGGRYEVNDFQAIDALWGLSRDLLRQSVGTSDGFPMENSEGTVYYLPYVKQDTNWTEKFHLHALPKITVITPSYNQGIYLEQTIQSILRQNYPNLEYMIMDGGSTDTSVEIIKKYENQLSYWVSEKDKGPAEAINKGFERATGDIVCWVNSDDCLSQDALWEAAAAFQKHPGVKVVYGHVVYVDEKNDGILMDHGYQKTKIYYGYQQSFEKTIEYWNTVYMIPQPAVFFKRELLEQHGILNEEYKFIFDYELFLRWTHLGISFHLIDRVQAFYRIHNTSKTSGFESFYPELYRHSRSFWEGDRNVWYRSFLRFFSKKIKPFYPAGQIGKLKWYCRILITGVQIVLNRGNPEKHFVHLVRRNSG